jgi:hypothetical protein
VLGVGADLNVARQAMPLGCRWVALPLRVCVTGCGQRGRWWLRAARRGLTPDRTAVKRARRALQ